MNIDCIRKLVKIYEKDCFKKLCMARIMLVQSVLLTVLCVHLQLFWNSHTYHSVM